METNTKNRVVQIEPGSTPGYFMVEYMDLDDLLQARTPPIPDFDVNMYTNKDAWEETECDDIPFPDVE